MNKKQLAFRIFMNQMGTSIQNILKQYWGYDSFRDSQEEVINQVMNGKNSLALLPTGGGKSICYQVPALTNDGICIVVSPLIALMKDQVENLKQKGIKAIAIFSGMNKREIDIALDNCVYGNIKFLYVSPERLTTEIFRERVKKMPVNLIAIDEAHCISQWGNDFRPSYKKIAEIKELIPKQTPFLAVTATANKRVINDICTTLAIDLKEVVKQSFERVNLGYLVLKEENKEARLLKILKKTKGSGIVYVNSRKNSASVSRLLNNNGISSDFYHAGLPQQERDRKQHDWINNDIQVIVSTNAFGMGIDKSNVRVVVHMEVPSSPEAYFQEAGRAGRDGKKSFAVLLYKPSDRISLEKFHELEYPEKKEIKTVYNCLGNYFRLAIGGGEFANYDFNLSDFCSQFNLNPLTTHHCISILSLSGYLSLSEAIYRPPRVKLSVTNNELYGFQTQNEKYEGLIQLLLRKNEGVFDSYIKISPYSIANALKKSESEVEKTLAYLTSISILDYKSASDIPQLTYLQNRVHEDRLKFPKEVYKERKKVKKEQLDFMIRYCESELICRSKLLLSYFDESDYKDCGQCDVCIERNKQALSVNSFEAINTLINGIVTKNLIGLTELVNEITNHEEDKVIEVIQWKLDNNELVYNELNQLVSTKKEV